MSGNGNLFIDMPDRARSELFTELTSTEDVRIERIVSTGQATPKGQWYDQDWNEWVLLIEGAARLRFEDGNELVELCPGDYVNIPARRRHRVEWTDPEARTLWLAVHYR